jgi:hypothetical protein
MVLILRGWIAKAFDAYRAILRGEQAASKSDRWGQVGACGPHDLRCAVTLKWCDFAE